MVNLPAHCILVKTGLGSVFNTAPVTEGDNVVVFGCGTVGLCVVMASRIAGANMVIAVDIEKRLAIARAMGVSMLLNPFKIDVGMEVLTATEHGCDFAFECVGKVDVKQNPQAMKQAYDLGLGLKSSQL